MKRAVVLLALITGIAAADPPADVVDFLNDLVSSLARGDASDFLHKVDPAMPEYAQLRRNVETMLAQSDAGSAIDFRAEQSTAGNPDVIELDLDWTLTLTSRNEELRESRHHTVHLKLQRKGKKWKVAALKPVDFFGPASAH